MKKILKPFLITFFIYSFFSCSEDNNASNSNNLIGKWTVIETSINNDIITRETPDVYSFTENTAKLETKGWIQGGSNTGNDPVFNTLTIYSGNYILTKNELQINWKTPSEVSKKFNIISIDDNEIHWESDFGEYTKKEKLKKQ